MATANVTIIDYGIGNLRSIEKAFEAVGGTVVRTDDPARILASDRAVLPGVGAFGACMDELRRRNLVEPIREFVATGRPFIGVCIGLQLLFERSTELGDHAGIGLLPGIVDRFDFTNTGGTESRVPNRPLKVPHMGWNAVTWHGDSPLVRGLEQRSYFYFVHSYHAHPARPEDVIGTSDYGGAFPAVVGSGNVFGVQFHPEKSQQNGLVILRNFSNLSADGLVHEMNDYRQSAVQR